MKKTSKIIPFLLLTLSSCGGGSSSSSVAPSSDLSSEEEEVLELVDAPAGENTYVGKMSTEACYEVFVYSFADSNGDGIGDLKGVEGKLDYLHELGVRNLWLSPVHPSNTYHKYNVADYYDIDPAYGTLADFESLCRSAKAKGISIFMDMVFNHSGLDNPLFTQAIEDYLNGATGEDSLADLYVISTDDAEVGNTKAIYTYNGVDIWYECNFDRSMPEFNLRGKAAPKLHENVMRYWIGKGADGFRFDGVGYYAFGDTENSLAYVDVLSKAAKAIKEDVYLIAEFWENSQTYVNLVPEHGMTCFNFTTSDTITNSVLQAMSMGSGSNFAKTLGFAVSGFSEGSKNTILPAFFISNHDQDRWAKRLDDAQFRQVAALYILTPGTPYLYYGEEIGLLGTRKVMATDANRRLPMQWRSDKNADTERATDILSQSDYTGEQTALGALEAIQDASSITAWYKQVLNFRLTRPEIKQGTFANLTPARNSPLAAFRITYQGKRYYLIHNLDQVSVRVAMPEAVSKVSGFSLGESSLSGTTLSLGPNATAYLQA